MSLTPLSINGALKVTATATGKLEVEDGEIDDANVANTQQIPPPANGVDRVEITAPEAQAPKTPPAKSEDTSKPPPEDAGLPSGPTGRETQQPTQPAATTNAVVPQKAPPEQSISTTGTQNSVPSRPEVSRGGPNHHPGDRPPHSLPTRPESNHYRGNEYASNDRRGERPMPRDVRDSRYSDLSRSSDIQRDRLSERHSSAPYQRHHDRALDRPVDRPAFDDRDRLEAWDRDKNLLSRGPPDDRYSASHSRDTRPPARDDRDRFARDKPHSDFIDSGRGPEGQGRSRDSSMAPPRPGISQPSDRAVVPQPQDLDRGHSMTHPDRRIDSSRLDSHPGSARGSRTGSPARRDDPRPPRLDGHRERDDRHATDSRRPPDDTLRPHSGRYDDSRPPTGPRGESGQQNPSDRFRETFRNQPNNTHLTDLNHGRLNQDVSVPVRQSEQYGRLNAGTDIPSGPRLPNGNAPAGRSGGRQTNNPQHINTQLQPASQASLPSPKDRMTPTGPSSSRGGPPRNPTQFNRNPQAPSSTPQTPIAESPDMAGIHPDRIKAFQESEAISQLRHQQATSSSTHVGSQANSDPAVSSPSAAPRGPNSGQAQVTFGSSRQGPPTGPSLGGDRGRGDKRFANLQNIIQQSGGSAPQSQGTSIRGRGGRANNAINNHLTSPVTPGPPVAANTLPSGRQDMFSARPDLKEKPDLFSGGSSGPGTPKSNEDDRRDGRDGRRDRARDEGERRPTRREGRSPVREAAVASGVIPPQIPPAGRGDERPTRRGDDFRRDQGRGGMPMNSHRDPPPRRGSRDEILDRDRRVEPMRRDMDEWNGDRRNAGPPVPERRDDRERDRRDMGSIGRKRGRGEEDLMGPVHGGDRGYVGENKRPRRNG